MKVAILHEMLVKLGGAEKVVSAFLEIFPKADLFTLIYDEKKVWKVFPKSSINKQVFKLTSNKVYKIFKNQRLCFPFMAKSVESLDFSSYDLLLCSSSWFAHGAITKPETKFVVYYHSPSRYLWDYTNEYKNSLGLSNWIKKYFRYFFDNLLSKARIWDYIASRRVDLPIAASRHVSKRILKYYKRDDFEIVYPPVETKKFSSLKISSKDSKAKKDYFVTICALTEWKRLDVAIKAFNKMPSKKLKIIWIWNYEQEYKKMVKSKNIEFLWYKDWYDLVSILKLAKGFVFVSSEDFGISPIEAISCGTPVFWLASWWLLETNIAWKTWEFFYDKDWKDFLEYFKTFEKNIDLGLYKKQNLLKQANKFSKEIFIKNIKELLSF